MPAKATMAECSYCNGEMLTVTGCTHRRYTIEGNEYPAVLADPHGQQAFDSMEKEQ